MWMRACLYRPENTKARESSIRMSFNVHVQLPLYFLRGEGVCLPSLHILTLFQNRQNNFLHSIVSQGEGYLSTLWVGVCRPSFQILTLFQTPKDISYTLLLAKGKSTYLHFGWGWVCRPSLQILTLSQTPKDISYTFLLARERGTYLHFGWECVDEAFKS